MTAPYINSYLQLRDDAGDPAVGWKIWTYAAGTSTLKDTYLDYNQAATNTNPVILDDEGSAVIWMDGAYKFVITDADDNVISTQDNINSIADVDLDGLTATVPELNATNTSVITVGDEDYTVNLTDRGKTILYSTLLTAPRTVSLPSAVTAGNGFIICVKSLQGSTQDKYINIIPNGTETIDGFDEHSLSAYNEDVWVLCDGSNWLIKSKEERGVPIPISADSSVYTLDGYVISADASAGSINLSLPFIVPPISNGMRICVKKIDSSSNVITITPDGTDTIDGAASLSLSLQNESYTLIADTSVSPTVWRIIGEVTTVSLFVTGDVKTSFTTSQAGWVAMNDGSIGSASSGATTRANADTENLFKLLWANVTDTYAPVSGGRGASANDDWAADKTLTLPRALGRVMACYGAGSGLTSREMAQYIGEEDHVLTTAELAPHPHPYNETNYHSDENQLGGSHPYYRDYNNIDTGTVGSGTAHNTMQPTLFVNFLVKL